MNYLLTSDVNIMEVSYIGRQYVRDEFERNGKMLTKLNNNINKCNTQLIAVKLKVSALQIQMNAMQSIYKDLMELRKIILILNPHLATESGRKLKIK